MPLYPLSPFGVLFPRWWPPFVGLFDLPEALPMEDFVLGMVPHSDHHDLGEIWFELDYPEGVVYAVQHFRWPMPGHNAFVACKVIRVLLTSDGSTEPS